MAGLAACGIGGPPPPDIILVGGKVYTLTWPDPDGEGRAAREAPFGADGWQPDAEAVAISGDRIVLAGSRDKVEQLKGPKTRVIDLHGATVLPGLIDSHVHLANLGASLDRVNLVGVETEAQAVELVAARAATVPKGEWIVGWGWDEGAWTSHLPTLKLLSQRVPDHPVILHGLHTFAVWGNQLAFDRAGITKNTQAPAGGEIKKDASGNPTGVLINNAHRSLDSAVPPPTQAQLADRVAKVSTPWSPPGSRPSHEAGADSALLAAMEDLDEPTSSDPVYVMLAVSDTALIDAWAARGPQFTTGTWRRAASRRSTTVRWARAAPSFSRRMTTGPIIQASAAPPTGSIADRVATMMKAGFQATIHAIGDRANREALDFFAVGHAGVAGGARNATSIEHAQIVSPVDVDRFATIGVIASMQPSHAVEDMAWAEARIGPSRVKKRLRVALAPPRRREDGAQLGSAGHGLQHLLRLAFGGDAHGQAGQAGGRLAHRTGSDDRRSGARLDDLGRVRGVQRTGTWQHRSWPPSPISR